jgi:hypothetical protein
MDFELHSPNGISSRYKDPAVVMADTSVWRLTKNVEPETVRALMTINGGEKVQWNDTLGWHLLADGRQRPLAEP